MDQQESTGCFVEWFKHVGFRCHMYMYIHAHKFVHICVLKNVQKHLMYYVYNIYIYYTHTVYIHGGFRKWGIPPNGGVYNEKSENEMDENWG